MEACCRFTYPPLYRATRIDLEKPCLVTNIPISTMIPKTPTDPSTEIEREGVIAVITRADRFLVIRRSEHVIAPGAFCFPGGGIEAAETETDALIRELDEELGVAIRPLRRLWRSVTPWRVALAWWLTELPEDATLRPNASEVAETHWLTKEEIRRLPELLSSNHAFLDALEAGEFTIDGFSS